MENSALAVLQRLRPTLEARVVAHAWLFGSVAREQASHMSDVDVLITPHHGRRLGLLDLGAIQSILEGGFAGLHVDVVVEPVGRSEMQEAIARDRVHAF